MPDKQTVLNRLDIQTFFSHEIPSLKWNGSGWGQGLCPFHNDRRPSFYVNQKTSEWNCTSCNKRGNIFDFYMMRHGVDVREAFDALAQEDQEVEMKTTLDFARFYVKNNISVIPLLTKDKKPLMGWMEFRERRPTDEELIKWFGNGSSANIGIVAGPISNLAIIDFDTSEAVEYGKRNSFLAGPLVKTAKGYHAYYRYRDGVRNFQKREDLPGIDLRADGGYVVAPPSLHPSGIQYRWVKDRGLTEIPMVELPEIILQKKPEHKTPITELYQGTTQGSRNNNLARLAGSWVNDKLTLEECLEQARIWNVKNTPPLPDREVDQTVRSIYNKHHREPVSEHSEATQDGIPGILDSDMANAARFAKQYGKDVRFTPERGWLAWDNTRWKSNMPMVMQWAKQTAQSIFEELQSASPERQKEIFKWARQSQDSRRLMSMLFLAQSEPGIPENYTNFDADPWRLNVLNGIINLRTGELEPHRQERLCSRIVPVKYDVDAQCERWVSFLGRVLAGNIKLINYVQKAIGYSLTGLTGEQILFFLFGLGANGKTVLLEILNMLFGDYAAAAAMETFTLRQGNSIPNDIARLAGARFVAVNETSDGQRLHEPLVKDLTGGDTITARFLHREFFEFRPQFKLWVRGNHKPVIRGTDDGIWRRIHLIPFAVQIPEAERDHALVEKLRAELPGILAWAVKGCLEWQKTGLNAPDEVRAAVQEYRAESDILGAFLAECCLEGGSSQVSAKDLYASYRSWAEKSGEHPVSQRRFGAAMNERGFNRERLREGVSYLGISFRVNDVNDCEPNSIFSPYRRAREEKNLEKGSQGSQNFVDLEREVVEVVDDIPGSKNVQD